MDAHCPICSAQIPDAPGPKDPVDCMTCPSCFAELEWDEGLFPVFSEEHRELLKIFNSKKPRTREAILLYARGCRS